MDWIGLAQYRDVWRALVNVIMNFQIPLRDVSFSSGYTTVVLSSSAQFHRVSQSFIYLCVWKMWPCFLRVETIMTAYS
jgi:hypothetical protein